MRGNMRYRFLLYDIIIYVKGVKSVGLIECVKKIK